MKRFLVHLYFFTLCLLSFAICSTPKNQPRPKWTLPESPQIAIIGGGVGGCGLAYFLKELLGEHSNVRIDLYEKSNRLGGRLDTVELFGKHYETGGSIIHPRNKYAVDLVEKLGLRQLRKKRRESASGFSLLKDHKVVFSSSSWRVVTILRILYRYGLDFNYVHSLTDKLIDDFSNIYSHQQRNLSYENPLALLASMSPTVANLTQINLRSFLQNYGLKDLFIDELVQAITYVNYGQDANIHSLVGTIAMAGADDGLFSIENGNRQLPLALAKASKVNLFLNSNVHGIVNHQDGTYGISISSPQDGDEIKNYDIVVIANPLEVSKLKFVDFAKLPYDVDLRLYHRTVSTIVAGQLQENFTLSQKELDSVFTCDAFTFFTSVSLIYPVEPNIETSDNRNVYKIFSPKPLTENQLEIIFSKIYEIKVFDWLAYPQYDSNPKLATLPSFILDDRNLYYVNSIEWAASAIEMSLVSAKNIANLIAQRITSQNIGDDHQNYNYDNRKYNPNVEPAKLEL